MSESNKFDELLHKELKDRFIFNRVGEPPIILRDSFEQFKAGAEWAKKQRVEEMLASATVVYSGRGMTWPNDWTLDMPESNRDRKALLINIEELKKECKHEPSPIDKFDGEFVRYKDAFCKHCGVELVAEWSKRE